MKPMGAESCGWRLSKHSLVVIRGSSLTMAAGNEMEMKFGMGFGVTILFALIIGN